MPHATSTHACWPGLPRIQAVFIRFVCRYAAGQENGVVVGSGAQCTYAVLVHEGLPDPRTLLRSDVAGDALTQNAAVLLSSEAGGTAGALVDLVAAQKAKESLGVVRTGSSGTIEVCALARLPCNALVFHPLPRQHRRPRLRRLSCPMVGRLL